ncbi:uncharacterized protein LOC18028448 [Eutrema salsugineum]|uniref:uncharacterized protein LOC18028448 n=1 Tax=Eutrema salsugineum TaxID=72664 RepID=UPI000CED120F|nr:uncharacterized protein LOC18028448 [Eutrema salsugineum]
MSTFTSLTALKPFKTQSRIRVKILKLWKQYLNGIETMEMVVVDELNQTMHVSMKKQFIKKFENLLEEGTTKIITNFQVTHNGGKFRTTSHVYKIQFAATTSVRPSEDLDATILGLKFVNFTDIHDGKLNPYFLIDIVGQIVSIGEVEILNVNKKQTKRLTMTLRDTSLPKDDVTLSYTHPNQLTIVNSVSVRDGFFLHTPRRTISEILGASEVEKCVTMATIMSIDTEFGWYYMSCKVCSKKVLPLDMDLLKEQYPGRPFRKQLWKCGKCKDDVESVVPAFMLTFRVMDNTGETKFLIFDKLAMKVVNQTAAQLTESVEEIQDPDVLPLPISNICGKTYLFKLSFESSNIVFNSDVYKVTKIVTQSDMVKEFSEISGFLTTPDVKSEEMGFITPDEQSKRKSEEIIDFDDHNGEQSTSKKAFNGDMKTGLSEEKISLKPVKKEKVDD